MMCRVLHLLREPGEEEVEVLRPSDDVAQVLEDRLQIGCRSAADRLHKRRHLVLAGAPPVMELDGTDCGTSMP